MENKQTIIRRRAPKWSIKEVDALFDAVKRYSKQILGTLANDVSSESKKEAWKAVAAQVNSGNCTRVQRSVKQVERKWWDFKSVTKKVLTAWKTEDGTNAWDHNMAARVRKNHYRVISIIGEQSVSSENAMPMYFDLDFDATDTDDDEDESVASAVITPAVAEVEELNLGEPVWRNVKAERLTSSDYFPDVPVSPRPSAKSASPDTTQEPAFKKRKDEPKNEKVDVQKQILHQLTQLQETHLKILEQLEKRNEIEKEKLEMKKRKISSIQPSSQTVSVCVRRPLGLSPVT